MDNIKILKSLANESRVEILKLLKNPENFDPQIHLKEDDNFKNGICLGSIKNKLGLSQSTVSQYLSVLVDANLLESKRIRQWTYFRRNEKTIKELSKWIEKEL